MPISVLIQSYLHILSNFAHVARQTALTNLAFSFLTFSYISMVSIIIIVNIVIIIIIITSIY